MKKTSGLPMSLVAAALLSTSCGAALMKLPSGPGAPAPDARDIVAEATGACRRVATLTAEIAVSGSVGGHRLRARLSAGLASPASARLEAVAPFGSPLFIFVASGNDATLLLPQNQRVLEHGRPDAVLEAIAGVPLDTSDLRTVMTGCAVAPDADRGRQLGDAWRVVPDGPDELYLRRDPPAGPWRLVARVHAASVASGFSRRGPEADDQGASGWRAEYRAFQDGLPTAIRLASHDPGRFDLRLSLSQVDLNMPLGPEVFRVQIPRFAIPITLSELKQSGPLSSNGR